jgi:uncharacterized protein
MTRMLLLLIAVLVFIWLLRRALSGRKRRAAPGAKKAAPVPELVACARCGVHLPRSEAVASGEEGAAVPQLFFCSPEHLRLGPD